MKVSKKLSKPRYFDTLGMFLSGILETDSENLRLPFLAHESERITSRVKYEAISQNDKSRALK